MYFMRLSYLEGNVIEVLVIVWEFGHLPKDNVWS